MTERTLWLLVWSLPAVSLATAVAIWLACGSACPLILAAFVVGVWIGGAEW